LSNRAIGRRLGIHRDTVARALAAAALSKYSRAVRPSKLDPFKDSICDRLRADPSLPSLRLREMATELGYAVGKSIFDDYVREVRPRFVRPRTSQRTI
jgi:transposase